MSAYEHECNERLGWDKNDRCNWCGKPRLFNIKASDYEWFSGRPAEPLTQEKVLKALERAVDLTAAEKARELGRY